MQLPAIGLWGRGNTLWGEMNYASPSGSLTDVFGGCQERATGPKIGVEELELTAQSPDLNPIEHLCDELERQLRARPNRPH